MPVYKEGDFYIERPIQQFFLRKNSAWRDEGRLIVAGVIGFYAEGRWTGAEIYQTAITKDRLHFYPEFSDSRSKAYLDFTPAQAMTVVITDNLGLYLQNGSHVVATAHWDAGFSNVAELTISDIEVAPFSSMWVIFPETPDPAAAGLHISLCGELV